MEDGWQRVLRNLQTAQETPTPVGQTGFAGNENTTCTNANEWYAVSGTFTDETTINEAFEMVVGGIKSLESCKAIFGGSGNFIASKASIITIGLFVNGVNLEKANTVITFEVPLRTKPASRTIALLIPKDAVLSIRVKSTEAATVVTIGQLNALFVGI
jgi:hypothetical protein